MAVLFRPEDLDESGGNCRRGASAPKCESAPKQDATSDTPQLLNTFTEILFRVGSRSAPIGTLYVWCFRPPFQRFAAILAGMPIQCRFINIAFQSRRSRSGIRTTRRR